MSNKLKQTIKKWDEKAKRQIYNWFKVKSYGRISPTVKEQELFEGLHDRDRALIEAVIERLEHDIRLGRNREETIFHLQQVIEDADEEETPEPKYEIGDVVKYEVYDSGGGLVRTGEIGSYGYNHKDEEYIYNFLDGRQCYEGAIMEVIEADEEEDTFSWKMIASEQYDKIQDLKQELEDEKWSARQWFRQVNRWVGKFRDLKRQVGYHQQNEEELRQELKEKELRKEELNQCCDALERELEEKEEEVDFKVQHLEDYRREVARKNDLLKEKERKLEFKKDRVEELEEKLGKRNKELRAIKSALDSDTKELAKQKETTQFWGEEAMKLEQLLREKDQQPTVEEIMTEIRQHLGYEVARPSLERILHKHLN